MKRIPNFKWLAWGIFCTLLIAVPMSLMSFGPK